MNIIDSRNFHLYRVASGIHFLGYSIGSFYILLCGSNLKEIFDKLIDRLIDYYSLSNMVKK